MRNQLKSVAALLLVAIVLVLPSFAWGPNALDSGPYNYVWTHQFAEAFARGELYPRWMPDSFRGLGSPAFFFYPPLAFYVSGLIELAGAPTWQAINIAAVAFLWASGLTMWLWLKDRSTRPLLWAGVYMAASYHLADFYIRAALAEFAAYAWLPLVAMGLDRRPRLLAVAFAGLICTHLPTAVLCGVFMVAPLVVAKLVRRERIVDDALAGAAAIGLSAIYLLPALTLQRYVSMAELWSADFRPSGMSVWAGNVRDYHLATAAAIALLALGVALSARRPAASWIWPGMAIGCAGLAVGVAPWVWSAPLLDKVQFPYRLLGVAEFALATTLALWGPTLRTLFQPVAAVGVFAWIAAWTFNAGIGEKMIRRDSRPERAYVERELPDAPEYMPAGAAPPGLSMRSRYPAVERFLPADRFNFPIWRVVERGRPVAVTGPTIPVGAHVTRQVLPVERIGAGVSCFSLLLVLAWGFVARRASTRSARSRTTVETSRASLL